MTIKEQLDAKLKEVKTWFASFKDQSENTLKSKDGKELKFSGELKEGAEIKCGDAAIVDGVTELEDGRKVTAKDGKVVSIEAAAIPSDPNEALKKEVEDLKAANKVQAEEIKTMKANFSKVMEGNEKLIETIEKVALAMESEDGKTKGGNEGGEDGMTMADWVVKRASKI